MVKKQVYASLSTVTSMAIVQKVNFTIRYKNQYLDIRYFSIIAQHYLIPSLSSVGEKKYQYIGRD